MTVAIPEILFLPPRRVAKQNCQATPAPGTTPLLTILTSHKTDSGAFRFCQIEQMDSIDNTATSMLG
jgi:hypothetical protein